MSGLSFWKLVAKHPAGRLVLVLAACCTLLAAFGCVLPKDEYIEEESAPEPTNSDHSYLARYGYWSSVDPYGDVWQPDVSSDWEPFTDGNWVWSDQGWTWVSYEPYGWLVYHYGNWEYRSDLGWFWIPSHNWMAAPVQWVTYDDYIAWAPTPPPGVILSDPTQPNTRVSWTVVRTGDFVRERVGKYKVVRVADAVRTEPVATSHEAPTVKLIAEKTKRTITTTKIGLQPASFGETTYHKMVLPDSLARSVAKKTATKKSMESKTVQPEKKTVEESAAKHKEKVGVSVQSKSVDTKKQPSTERSPDSGKQKSDSTKTGDHRDRKDN